MIGKTISHYKILEKLGEGGMGVVYKAEDTKLKRTVALKFLPPDLTRDPEAKKRFIHEAQAASALQHDNICAIHDIDETPDGQSYIVMDCYEGETLKEKIQRGPLKIEEALDIAIQISEGLQEAHAKGIVHRDIKPANLMVTAKGEVKIMDFGLAKLSGKTKLTKTGSTLGTVQYMSPEQARGEKVDHRTDIWSLGVVLYEMIAGMPPFKGDYEQSVVYSILNEEPEPLTSLRSGTPMALENIVAKLLAKKPGERYQHLDELSVDLRKVGSQSTVQVSIKKKTLNPVWIAAPIVLFTLVGLYLFLPRKTEVSRKSIAVLPFQNLSAEGPYAYFAGGLHDELLTQLSKVAALKVISRTSVMGYAGTLKPIKEIASELGVRSIVEGSVQVSGERLRVNVQLIDAHSDAHLWAEKYDRTLDDAFAIQSDVARQIVAEVGATLSNSEQQGLIEAPTENTEAYRLYLQGMEYYNRPGYLNQNLEVAQELYERALALDPDFALAHAALSEAHGFIYWERYDPLPARAALQREEAEKALRLTPDLPQAHVAMGMAYYWGIRDYQRALEEFEIALKKLPNDAKLWYYIGCVHRRLGHWEEVITAFEKATHLNPRDANLFFDLGGYTYRIMHRYADAVRAFDRALILAPDLRWIAIIKGWTYVRWQGQLDTLRSVFRRLPRDEYLRDPHFTYDYFDLLYWERQPDSLLKALRMMSTNIIQDQTLFMPVTLYAAWAHRLRGNLSAANAAFVSALTLLDSALRELPNDWRLHRSRGLVLAGLGRRKEALDEARWLEQCEDYRKDAYVSPFLAKDRAQILAQIGEDDEALDEIERLLTGPSHISVHSLQLDPLWDPIRENPRFKALLAKYAKRYN